MKKNAFLSVVFLFGMSVLTVQGVGNRTYVMNTLGTNVNTLSIDNFEAQFGDLPNVHWKITNGFDEAVFMLNGKEMQAFYDTDGQFVGTTQSKTFSDLPAEGQKEIRSLYDGYKTGAVIFFKDNEINVTQMIMYGIEFGNSDNYFVELTKGSSRIVVKVDMLGNVTFFKEL